MEAGRRRRAGAFTVVLCLGLAVGGCGEDEPESVPAAPSAPSSPCPDPVASPGATKLEVAADVEPSVETRPVSNPGDAADDAAIWVHPTKPERSAVIATDKQGAILVYDLDGVLLQERPDGELDNVDLRCTDLLGEPATIVTAGNRTDNTISIYRFDPDRRRLDDVAERKIEVGIETYGSCMSREPGSGRLHYFVTSYDGDVEQWELRPTDSGTVDARMVRTISLASTVEACVVDDASGTLFLAEEERGIWRVGAAPETVEEPELVAPVQAEGGHLVPDVEGLAVAHTDQGAMLFASSQGDDRFVVYGLTEQLPFLGAFEIDAADGIDEVNNTDGIEVNAAPLGDAFPHGVLVVHDGENGGANQNFKLVPLERVIPALAAEPA